MLPCDNATFDTKPSALEDSRARREGTFSALLAERRAHRTAWALLRVRRAGGFWRVRRWSPWRCLPVPLCPAFKTYSSLVWEKCRTNVSEVWEGIVRLIFALQIVPLFWGCNKFL